MVSMYKGVYKKKTNGSGVGICNARKGRLVERHRRLKKKKDQEGLIAERNLPCCVFFFF